MDHFLPLLSLGLKRRSKDFFVLFYSIVFPMIVILLLGYLSSKSYGNVLSSYHYYAIVTVPFCSLMAVSTVSYATQDEKMANTSLRFLTAPITKVELILSKLFSCAIVLSLCNVVTLGAAKLLFQMDFKGNFFNIIILLTAETFMVSGIGVYLGLAFKNLNAVRNFLNLPLCIFGFLGGAFFPIGSLNPIFAGIINTSPLTWVNRGIVSSIYDNNAQILWTVTIIFVQIGVIFTGLTILFFKKEAFK